MEWRVRFCTPRREQAVIIATVAAVLVIASIAAASTSIRAEQAVPIDDTSGALSTVAPQAFGDSPSTFVVAQRTNTFPGVNSNHLARAAAAEVAANNSKYEGHD